MDRIPLFVGIALILPDGVIYEDLLTKAKKLLKPTVVPAEQ